MKFFLVASFPLGLLPWLIQMAKKLGVVGWILFTIGWPSCCYVGIGLTVQACRDVSENSNITDYSELLNGSRFGRFLLYLYNDCLFQVIMKIISWVTCYSGSLHYLGCALAITLQCVICLCFRHDGSGLGILILKNYSGLIAFQIFIDLFMYGVVMKLQLATTCLVVFISIVLIPHLTAWQ